MNSASPFPTAKKSLSPHVQILPNLPQLILFPSNKSLFAPVSILLHQWTPGDIDMLEIDLEEYISKVGKWMQLVHTVIHL